MSMDILNLVNSSDWEKLNNLLDEFPELANYTDVYGESLLMRLAGKGGSENLITKAIILGADPNFIAMDGSNAISKAINNGNQFGLDTLNELKALLKMGANPNLIADCGYPALHWSVIMNKPQHLKILIEFGADVNSKTSDFPPENLTQIAQRVGSNEVIEILKSLADSSTRCNTV